MEKEFLTWRVSAWNGPVLMVAFGVFWMLMSHNLPPIPASADASVVATLFRESPDQVRIGMVMSMSFSVTYVIWSLAIGKALEYITGHHSLIVELAKWGGGLTIIPIITSSVFMLTAAFRPDVLPDWQIQMLYDMGWFMIDCGYSVTSVQSFAIAAGILADKRAVPLFPRWLGWFSIWQGLVFVALVLIPFVRDGAFSRSGILNFWTEYTIIFIWLTSMSVFLFKAIAKIEREIGHG